MGETIDLKAAVTQQTVFSSFLVTDPQPMEDGGAQVNFLLAGGQLMSYPLDETQRKDLGRKLLAPHLKVAKGGIPPEVKAAQRESG